MGPIWNRMEPVRSYVYTLLLPAMALLVFYGVVSDQAAPLWIAAGTAVLGITGTEVARSKVSPVTKSNQEEFRSMP